MNRDNKQNILEDLDDKMVFVGGPRQVGKTTLALSLLDNGNERHPAYRNWDDIPTRKALLRGEIPSEQSLIILDGIHKHKHWRNLVKGFYDLNKSAIRFLVTGSARLDHYRRGGDSLQGRYHYHRLHPFSLHEVDPGCSSSAFEQLLEFGGFPEPFLKASTRHWKRWQRERQSRVVREDLVNLESVREVSQMDLLATVLPDRVGAPLSINNLREDLAVAFETADRWVGILENLYYCFRIPPFGFPALRAARKERKVYMWDWSLCSNPAARFENLVASHLLKFCHFTEDAEGDRMELCFMRDSMRREIDFLVVRNKKPLFAVECKSGEADISRNIAYFSQRTSIPIFYQVHLGQKDYELPQHRARVLPFTSLAKTLAL